jgi:hypothetical protein
MSHLIDRVLLLALLIILADLAAHFLSLTVGAVLTAAMTPIADALDHVLRVSTLQGNR